MYMPASAARPPIILCFEQVNVVSATLSAHLAATTTRTLRLKCLKREQPENQFQKTENRTNTALKKKKKNNHALVHKKILK